MRTFVLHSTDIYVRGEQGTLLAVVADTPEQAAAAIEMTLGDYFKSGNYESGLRRYHDGPMNEDLGCWEVWTKRENFVDNPAAVEDKDNDREREIAHPEFSALFWTRRYSYGEITHAELVDGTQNIKYLLSEIPCVDANSINVE